MVANALCYAVAICTRNAGSPTIAIGQFALICLPIMAAAAWVGSPAMIALLITIVLLIPAMISITFNVFHVLRDSILAAENSTQLADKLWVRARTKRKDVVQG